MCPYAELSHLRKHLHARSSLVTNIVAFKSVLNVNGPISDCSPPVSAISVVNTYFSLKGWGGGRHLVVKTRSSHTSSWRWLETVDEMSCLTPFSFID